MKIKELYKVSANKIGRIVSNSVTLEAHEYGTILFLTECGFDVELIRASNIPNFKNPDIAMLGTFWEMKGPITMNRNKIKNRFRKAIRQSGGHAIFDIRRIRKGADEAKSFILELFETTSGMKRIIIIFNDEKENGKEAERIFDIFK